MELWVFEKLYNNIIVNNIFFVKCFMFSNDIFINSVYYFFFYFKENDFVRVEK